MSVSLNATLGDVLQRIINSNRWVSLNGEWVRCTDIQGFTDRDWYSIRDYPSLYPEITGTYEGDDQIKLEQEMVASFLRAANPSDHKQLCILTSVNGASEMTKQEWQKLHEDMVYSFLDKCDLDDFWPVFSQLVRMQMKFNVQLREN